jgi:hypothetical protein
MQRGHQYQRDRLWGLLRFQPSDYPPDLKVDKDFEIVANSTLSKMTRDDAYAACRLARAFLNQAFDFEGQGSKFRDGYDKTALAFLNETGDLLAGRQVHELVRSRDVRDLYVDGLVTISMTTAVKLAAADRGHAKVASLMSMLVQAMFKSETPSFPGVSDDAQPVFNEYLNAYEGYVLPFLNTMGAGLKE